MTNPSVPHRPVWLALQRRLRRASAVAVWQSASRRDSSPVGDISTVARITPSLITRYTQPPFLTKTASQVQPAWTRRSGSGTGAYLIRAMAGKWMTVFPTRTD